MPLFYHLPHWQENQINKEVEAKEAKRKAFSSFVQNNIDFVPRLQENATAFGFLPTPTIVGASLYGLNPDRPEWDAIVDRWLKNEAAEQDRWKDAMKAGTRWAFVGMESMANAVDKGYKSQARANIDRGRAPWNFLATLGLAAVDPTYVDDVKNYYRAQPDTPYTQGINAMQAGENPNFGDGWLGESQKAEQLPIYKELVGMGADPETVRVRLQEELGAAITSDYREEVANFGSYTTEHGTVPLSIGRNIAVEIFEPDDWQFKLMSTVFDGAWRLGTDPTLWLGSGYAKMAKGVKMAPSSFRTKGILDNAETLTAARTAGLSDWFYRRAINKPALDEYFRKTESGYRIAEYLANAKTHKEIQALLKGQGTAALYGALKKADTAEQVIDLLLPHMGTAIKHRLDATSLLTRAVPRRVAGGLYSAAKGKGFQYGFDVGTNSAVRSLGADGTVLGRMFAPFPIEKLEVRNLDRTYNQLDEWMRWAGVSDDIAEGALDSISEMASQQAISGEINFVQFYNQLVDIWNNPKGTGVLNHIMDNFEKIGIPKEALKGIEKWWASVDETRKYFVTMGTEGNIYTHAQQIIPGQKFRTMMIDGKEMHMPQPTAQLIAEYTAEGFIPMPDIRSFQKLMGPFRTFLGKVLTLGLKETEDVQRFMAKPIVNAINLSLKAEGKDVARKGLVGLDRLKSVFYHGFVARASRVTKRGEFIEDAIRLEEAVITRFSSAIIQKMWKPLVLLRPAWTARVIGEEQLRMAAANMDSVFYHPLSWFGWVMGKTPANRSKIARGLGKISGDYEYGEQLYTSFQNRFAKGVYDVEGNITSHHFDHTAAMSISHGGWLGVDPERSRYWKFIDRPIGDDVEGYYKSWGRNLVILEKDPLVKEIARLYSGPNTADIAIENITKRFIDGDLNYIRKAFAGNVDESFSQSKKIILESDQKAKEYVESVWARIHYETGGSYEIVNLNTKRVYGMGETIDPTEWMRDSFTYKITKNGDRELIDSLLGAVADVEGGATKFLLREWEDEFGNPINILLGGGEEGTSQDAVRMLSEWLSQKKTHAAPPVIKGQRFDPDHAWANSLDTALEAMFDVMMSRPTNLLSRSPAFRQFYWEEISELLPYMDEVLANQVRAMAIKSNITKGKIGKKFKKGWEKHKSGKFKVQLEDAEGVLTQIDELAKSRALTHTQHLLYDLNRRHAVSDLLRNIVPFAEVYIEVLGTWSRLLSQNPSIPRYLQLGMDGAKKKGFIYTDPVTGEEFYNFSQFGDKLLTKWALGDQEETEGVEARLQTPSRVEGVNMITGGIGLGLGPLATTPLNYMLPPGDLTPTMEKIIFPFGRQPVQMQFTPSHFRKAWSLFSSNPDTAKLYEDTKIDVMEVFIDTGMWDDSTPEQQQKSMERISIAARNIIIYRAITQASLPTQAFVRYEYKATVPGAAMYLTPDEIEKNPEWFEVTLFSDAYWRMLAKHNGDTLRATDEFLKKFGFNPTALTTSKSKEKIPTSYTEEGLYFYNANQELFDMYPNSAYWLFPDAPTDEFFLTAYTNSFITGARESRDLDEWYEDGYKTALFNLAKENVRRNLYENPANTMSASARDQMFTMAVIDLANEYNIKEYPSITEVPIPSQLDELSKMLQNEGDRVVKLPDGSTSKIKNLPVFNAINQYLIQRAVVLGALQVRTGDMRASLARADAQKEREILNAVAERLIQSSPDFYFWFYNVGVKEFQDADRMVLPLFDGYEL